MEDLSKGPPSALPPQPKSRHLTIKYVGPMAGWWGEWQIPLRPLHPATPHLGPWGWWKGSLALGIRVRASYRAWEMRVLRRLQGGFLEAGIWVGLR